MDYIYLYTNKNNGKKYVGQTNNLQRRIREHRSVAFNKKSGNYNDYFHQALRKHTEEAFDITILYEGNCTQEELDQKEQFFIKTLHSHVSEWGYNLTWGGQGYKATSKYPGEDIKECLRSGMKYKDIQDKFKCSFSFISSINYGLRFYDPDQNYPIYNYRNFDPDTIYPQMVTLLQDPRYRFQEIADKLECSYATVKAFNSGKLRPGEFWDGEYPIRDRYFCDRPQWYHARELLLTTNIPSRTIGREICHISDKKMTEINQGLCLHDPSIKYPIRGK